MLSCEFIHPVEWDYLEMINKMLSLKENLLRGTSTSRQSQLVESWSIQNVLTVALWYHVKLSWTELSFQYHSEEVKQALIRSYFLLLLGEIWWDIWSVVGRGERESIQYNTHSNPLTPLLSPPPPPPPTFCLVNYFHIFATHAARHLFVKFPNNSVDFSPQFKHHHLTLQWMLVQICLHASKTKFDQF